MILLCADARALSCKAYTDETGKPNNDVLSTFNCRPYEAADLQRDEAITAIESNDLWREDREYNSAFWQDWSGLVEEDSPVMSTRAASTFYGLGFWMPEKYKNEQVDIKQIKDIEELIRQYGLLMSFGVGSEDPDSMRLRFDYRWHGWHEDNSSDVLLQLEIPFQ
ncbi:hypothetical protein [Photobacterium jeanii]|uniref:hypothetical protein n=1 Tax=Photobacterium jeanii TaxID=858640 RepID=UPI0011B243A6|nr:hypothetical protein [Photobacterium jeanii]